MSPPVLQLPLDLSGNAVTNRVTAELHPVAATGTRAFVLTRGPFFSRTLVLRNRATGVELVPDVDFRPVHLFIEASLRASDEICSVVVILPTCSATQIDVDYQAIGGEYSASVSAIEQLLESLDLDNRTIHWGDIIDAPEYFPPVAHPHDVGDLYGFEYVVAVLEQIRRAILLGDQAAFDELRQYVDSQDTQLRNLINSFQSLLDDHISDINNPHNTTKAQVGLGNVDDYATADLAAAQAGTANNLFMTPLRTAQAIAAIIGNSLNAHIANTNNPHNTTKAHVGLSNVVNYALATLGQAQAGSGDAYMTATLTGAAIEALAVTPLNNHIQRTDNPHNTTKAHVGLNNVDNYATATIQQAQAGTATNLFMTPAGTRQLIDTVVGDSLSEHINNTNNPHNTTKAQVGLGSVQNFAIASQVEAETGTSLELYMTPSTTRSAIVQFAVNPLNVHIGNTNNPHNTTKAQVGLGSVQDYGVASQSQAEAGTANNLYMTPLRTSQAVTALAINPLTTLINQRVVTGSNAQLNTLTINTSGYLYQDIDGSTVLRVADTRFFRFQADGNLVVGNGRVIASGGFQPSDRRLKTNIEAAIARPLWRQLEWKQWDMIQSGEHQSGFLAQHLKKAAPDRVVEYVHQEGKRCVKRLAVDNTGTALEMAYAAGQALDKLQKQFDEQAKFIAALVNRLSKLEQKD